MADNKLKNIAIVGASGNVGAVALKHLLEINPDVKITIISRSDSNATFPESSQITVKKGSYDDAAFLESAFQGSELAMFALSFMGGAAVQIALIDAAAKAGVKYIVPNDYSGDGTNTSLFSAVPMFHDKTAARQHIQELAKTSYPELKYIGVATNPWTELSISFGMFGFNVPERKATLYSGTGPFNSSSINQVGKGIAKLLSLPVKNAANPRASLEHYANGFVYISSYSITQEKVFESILRVTGTKESDWTIERSSIPGWIKASQEKLAQGDFMAGGGLVYAHYMGEGLGGDYEAKAKQDREVLGLKEESLDEVVKGALAGQ